MGKTPTLISFLVLVWIWLLPAAVAEPAVIGNVGRSEPISPYLDTMKGREDTTSFGEEVAKVLRMSSASVDYSKTQYPVHTPEMTPGSIILRHVRIAGLTQPVCMVGSGEVSMAWLRRHRARLVQLGAVCLVVEAKTKNDFVRIRSVAPKLAMQAVSGSSIADKLGILHYPVLVSHSFIEQ